MTGGRSENLYRPRLPPMHRSVLPGNQAPLVQYATRIAGIGHVSTELDEDLRGRADWCDLRGFGVS